MIDFIPSTVEVLLFDVEFKFSWISWFTKSTKCKMSILSLFDRYETQI